MKLTDKNKYEILKKEYLILFEEINSGYNVIQNRVGILGVTYAFIFFGFIAGLSQWGNFREFVYLIIIESVLLLSSFVLLIPAMFITIVKPWKSFGNPKDTIMKLQNSDSYESYYKKRSEDWPKITDNNKNVNKQLNILLLINYSILVLTLLIIFIHIILGIIIKI